VTLVRNAWLPKGYELPGGLRTVAVLHYGNDWQLLAVEDGARALVVRNLLAQRWIEADLIEDGVLTHFSFGSAAYLSLVSRPEHMLAPVADCRSPNTKAEALAFAQALKATRAADPDNALQDAIYAEAISRLLPTYSCETAAGDDVVLGTWLTGGIPISAKAFRRLSQSVSWLGLNHLKDIVETAGFTPEEVVLDDRHGSIRQAGTMSGGGKPAARTMSSGPFSLAGRPALEAFFRENVIDIVENSARYKALGIEFPSAIVLHGPPGCGKTFAIERLVEYLGWPCYQIDSSSVASPYIHETSRKIAEVFTKAMENSPSVLVIDEMEAFLSERDLSTGQHRVEEVAEFLRRIPEAAHNHVLIVAMTNRLDMIDQAILRRGRFDHVIKVDFATEEEIKSLLECLLAKVPMAADVDTAALIEKLAGRPLSDISFIVREGARLAARDGREDINQACLLAALKTTPSRGPEPRRIGFL
jgi:cell division protease FtsH